MAPSSVISEETTVTSTELQKIVKPCSVTAQDVDEDTELCIFRIPRGLLHVNDLVNCEIKLGGKKTSKINIKGKTFELNSRPMKDGAPMLPWFPDRNGALHPVAPESSVITEVSVRRCVDTESVPTASEEDLEHLKPVEHIPPELPKRDFFSGYNCIFAEPVHKKKSPKKTLKTWVPESNKNRLSLEEITPQDPLRRPAKKKKGDPLVANFQSIFNDICSSPANVAEKNCDAASSKKSQKKSKDGEVERKIKLEILSEEEALRSSSSPGESLETPERKNKNKGKTVKAEILEDDDTQFNLSSVSPKADKKKKKKRKRDDE